MEKLCFLQCESLFLRVWIRQILKFLRNLIQNDYVPLTNEWIKHLFSRLRAILYERKEETAQLISFSCWISHSLHGNQSNNINQTPVVGDFHNNFLQCMTYSYYGFISASAALEFNWYCFCHYSVIYCRQLTSSLQLIPTQLRDVCKGKYNPKKKNFRVMTTLK